MGNFSFAMSLEVFQSTVTLKKSRGLTERGGGKIERGFTFGGKNEPNSHLFSSGSPQRTIYVLRIESNNPDFRVIS